MTLLTLSPAQAVPSATIQSMIDAAPDGDTISIPVGAYTESLTVNKTLTLTSVSSATTIIQAIGEQRVITVTAGHNLRLENLTVTGGHPNSAVGSGAYVASGSLQIVNCRIANNSADYDGGVFQEGSTGRVDMTDSRIELNAAASAGGGLYAHESAVLTNTQVLSNTAGQQVDVGEFVPWDAASCGQVNPQYTDTDYPDKVQGPGYYSFVVPPGKYRILANAPGYLPYESDIIEVVANPVTMHIPMQRTTGRVQSVLPKHQVYLPVVIR